MRFGEQDAYWIFPIRYVVTSAVRAYCDAHTVHIVLYYLEA